MLLYSSAAVAGLSCPQYFSMLLSSYSCCYILQLRLLDCPVHSISLCYYHLIHVVIFFSCGCWIVLSTVFLYVTIILFMLLYSSAAVAGLSCPQYFSTLLSYYSCCYILQLWLLDCPVHSISLCYYHIIHVVIFFSCGCWIVLSTVFLYVIIILFMLLYSSAAVAGLSCPQYFSTYYYHIIHVVIFFSCGCWIVLSTVFLYVIIILFMLLYSSAAVAGLSCPQYFSMLLSSYSCCYILQLQLLDCPVHSISLCYYHLIHVVIFFSCGCWIVLSTVFLFVIIIYVIILIVVIFFSCGCWIVLSTVLLYVIIILFMLLYSSAVVAGLSSTVFLFVIIILLMLLYSSAAVAGLSCPQYFSMLLSSYSRCYILQLRLLDCPVHSISLCYYHLIHVVIFFSCGCWIVLSTVLLYVIIILFMLLYSSAAVAGLSCPQYFSMLLSSHSCCYILQLRLLDCPVHSISLQLLLSSLIHVVIFFSCGCWIVLSTVFLYVIIIFNRPAVSSPHQQADGDSLSLFQLLANGFVFACVNVAGVFTNYPTEAAQRQAFLETRRCIEARLITQAENQQQVLAPPTGQIHCQSVDFSRIFHKVNLSLCTYHCYI